MCELEKKEIRYTIMSYNLRYQEIGRSKMKSSFRFFFYKMKTSKSVNIRFLLFTFISTQNQMNDVLLFRCLLCF